MDTRKRPLTALVVALSMAGCQGPVPDRIARPAPPDKPIRLQLASLQRLPVETREVGLFRSYMARIGHPVSAMGVPDRRPAPEILADLKALPLDQKEALRQVVLGRRLNSPEELRAMGRIYPEGHRQFILAVLKKPPALGAAVQVLAETEDPAVVGPILAAAAVVERGYVPELSLLSKPPFLATVVRSHRTGANKASAYVLGVAGPSVESDIRGAAAQGGEVRDHVLLGLADSGAKGAIGLLRNLTDPKVDNDQPLIARGMVRTGASQVPLLVAWLAAKDEGRRAVAREALPKIPSAKGAAALLESVRGEEMPNVMAGGLARFNEGTVRAYIAREVRQGTKRSKLNALLLAHHLRKGDWRENREEPLLDSMVEASRDADTEIRYAAVRLLPAFAHPGRTGDMKALRRLVAMLKDPSPRVRSEAIVSASQYPSPEVLDLFKRMQKERQPAEVAARLADMVPSMEERLRNLPGQGREPMRLRL